MDLVMVLITIQKKDDEMFFQGIFQLHGEQDWS